MFQIKSPRFREGSESELLRQLHLSSSNSRALSFRPRGKPHNVTRLYGERRYGSDSSSSGSIQPSSSMPSQETTLGPKPGRMLPVIIRPLRLPLKCAVVPLVMHHDGECGIESAHGVESGHRTQPLESKLTLIPNFCSDHRSSHTQRFNRVPHRGRCSSVNEGARAARSMKGPNASWRAARSTTSSALSATRQLRVGTALLCRATG